MVMEEVEVSNDRIEVLSMEWMTSMVAEMVEFPRW